MGVLEEVKGKLMNHGTVVHIEKMVGFKETEDVLHGVGQPLDIEPYPEFAVVVQRKKDPLSFHDVFVKKRG